MNKCLITLRSLNYLQILLGQHKVQKLNFRKINLLLNLPLLLHFTNKSQLLHNLLLLLLLDSLPPILTKPIQLVAILPKHNPLSPPPSTLNPLKPPTIEPLLFLHLHPADSLQLQNLLFLLDNILPISFSQKRTLIHYKS